MLLVFSDIFKSVACFLIFSKVLLVFSDIFKSVGGFSDIFISVACFF